MQDLRQLELTEKDFNMIVEGLDALPGKDLAGDMLVDLLNASMMKDQSEEAKRQFENKIIARRKEKETNSRQLKEDIKILQGKMLLLKQHLMQEQALNTTYDIINRVK